MKFEENTPIYIQIMNYVKEKIINGNLKMGDKLPSVRELAEEIKVNPNTVQRAYQELEREEIAYSKRGMGRFITEDTEKIEGLKKHMADVIVISFIEGMSKIGYNAKDMLDIIKENLEKGCNDGNNS